MAELGCEAALLIHEGVPFLVFWGGSNVQGLKLRGSGDSLHSELCKQSLQACLVPQVYGRHLQVQSYLLKIFRRKHKIRFMILKFASVRDVFKGTEPSSFRNSVFLKGTQRQITSLFGRDNAVCPIEENLFPNWSHNLFEIFGYQAFLELRITYIVVVSHQIAVSQAAPRW